MERLTVAQIFNIKESTSVGEKLHIESIFFTNHFIYIIDQSNPKVMKKISFKKFQTVEQIPLPQTVYQRRIKSLTELNQIIVFTLSGFSDLFYINTKRQTFRLQSHIQPINKVICHNNSIVTCSDDFTVRVWNQNQGQIIKSKVKHIYSGHTDKVTCLQSYQNLLVSGSNDQTVIFWKNDQIHCQFKTSSSIRNLLKCTQSLQFLVFTENAEIQVLNLTNIIKYKKTEVLRTIKYQCEKLSSQKHIFDNCFEIDDSFIVFTDQNSVVFVQINLDEVINKKEISEKTNIVGVNCVGRMLIYANYHGDLKLLRF